MNEWLIAAAALAVGLVPCGWLSIRGETLDRLIAIELASLLSALIIVLMSEGFGRVSLYDLALALVLLSFASTLVFAHFLERWL